MTTATVGDDMPTGQPYVTGEFHLTDHDGEDVSDATYLGQWVIVFFGFTHCKMVCPRALARLSAVIERIGPAAEQIQPLYITVDPDRDTPEVMKSFLEIDYPRFTGLSGSESQVEDAKRSFRVFSTKVADPDDPDSYQTPHSAFTFVLGPDGRYRAHFTDAVDEDEMVERLEALLASGRQGADIRDSFSKEQSSAP